MFKCTEDPFENNMIWHQASYTAWRGRIPDDHNVIAVPQGTKWAWGGIQVWHSPHPLNLPSSYTHI